MTHEGDDCANESYVDSHQGRGLDYDIELEIDRDLVVLTKIEAVALRTVILKWFDEGRFDYLDAACGTGRITQVVAPLAREAMGVDVSASMLDVARSKGIEADLVCVDLAELSSYSDKKFDLVTAFRFFPNAEPELRLRVISALTELMHPGALFIFNNHQNDASLFAKTRRLLGRPVRESWNSVPFEAEISHFGLRVVQRMGVGYLPLGRRIRLPQRLDFWVEKWLSISRFFPRLARYEIIICQFCSTGRPTERKHVVD